SGSAARRWRDGWVTVPWQAGKEVAAPDSRKATFEFARLPFCGREPRRLCAAVEGGRDGTCSMATVDGVDEAPTGTPGSSWRSGGSGFCGGVLRWIVSTGVHDLSGVEPDSLGDELLAAGRGRGQLRLRHRADVYERVLRLRPAVVRLREAAGQGDGGGE